MPQWPGDLGKPICLCQCQFLSLEVRLELSNSSDGQSPSLVGSLSVQLDSNSLYWDSQSESELPRAVAPELDSPVETVSVAGSAAGMSVPLFGSDCITSPRVATISAARSVGIWSGSGSGTTCVGCLGTVPVGCWHWVPRTGADSPILRPLLPFAIAGRFGIGWPLFGPFCL